MSERPGPRPRDQRRDAFERMQAAYDAYRANPDRKATAFRALRALVRLCRLHGMTADQAALLAELGRVDDEATADWQVTLARRNPTRAMKARAVRERDRDMRSAVFSRQSRRFAAVLRWIEQGRALPDALTAVGAAERPPVGPDAIAKDYGAMARVYRDAGMFSVPFQEADRLVKLPHPGRPRGKKA